MHLRHRGSRLPLVVVAAVVVVAGLLVVGIPGSSPPVSAADPAADPALPPGAAGMRYSLNTGAEDGLGAASAPLELDEELRNALRRDDEGLVPVNHPDGSTSIHLQGRFQSASVARIGADGRVTVCVDDPGAVARGGSPAPKPEEQ